MHDLMNCRSVREGRIARSLMANTKGGLTGALRSRLAAQRKARGRRPGGGGAGAGGRPDGGAGQGRGDEDEAVVALLGDEGASDSDVESGERRLGGLGGGRGHQGHGRATATYMYSRCILSFCQTVTGPCMLCLP
jgi:hypothetical protein